MSDSLSEDRGSSSDGTEEQQRLHPAADAASRAPLARAARILLVPYSIGVLLLTWLPAADAGKVTGVVAVLAQVLAAWGVPFPVAYTALEFTANIALFVPLGVLLPIAWRGLPTWSVVAVGCAASVMIELVQLTMPSRYSTISDVVANTLGTAVGIGIVRAVSKARRTG